MRKHILPIIFLLTSLPVLAKGFPVTVKSCGKDVTFTQPPQRAIINDINMAEMAFSLHLQDKIVGLTGITGWYKLTSEFKSSMGAIPELAPKYPSLETLLAAQPDFFFAGWNYGMKIGGDVTPDKLASFGIKSLVLSESCIQAGTRSKKADMNLLYDDLLTLGQIFDKQREATALVNIWKHRLAVLSVRPVNQRLMKVFVYDSGEEKPFTSGKYGMPTAIIEAAGGRNVMDGLAASWATTSWESVAATEPDLIILLDYQSGSGADTLRHFLESHPLMKLTPAVQQHRYIKLKYEELTPGPANIDAIEKLTQALYTPEIV